MKREREREGGDLSFKTRYVIFNNRFNIEGFTVINNFTVMDTVTKKRDFLG